MEDPQVVRRPASSMVARVLFFIGGLGTLALGVLITLGIALVGGIVTGIVAWRFSKNQRRLTRRGAWFSNVTGTAAGLALFMGYAVLAADSNTKAMTAAERAEQRAKASQAVPAWMRSINPNAEKQSAAADSMAAQLLENKAVMIWAGLMGAVIASAMIGAIAGSFVWGGIMLLYRSFTGDWLASSASTAQAGA
jgi:hypothetical protein